MINLEKRKELFIKKANDVHNNKYDYSLVDYKSAKEDVVIICPIHGEFIQKPYHHLEGYGCHKCSSEKQLKLDYLTEARKIHGDKYDYSKFVYKNNKTKGTIICQIHGEFQMCMNAHITAKHGCPMCGIENTTDKIRLTTEEFIQKSKNVFGENAFDYKNVKYVNNKTPIELICKRCGRSFMTRGDNHLNGHGCPKCKLPSSKWEVEINDFIESLGIETEITNRTILGGKEIDIFIPKLMIGIECDGLRWHNDKFKGENYHLEKTLLAKENGVRLIHIYEDEWYYSCNAVKSFLMHELKVNQTKIYARKCEVRQITKEEFDKLMINNSIGDSLIGDYNYGLFYNDILCSAISFKQNDNDSFTLLNYVTNNGYSVFGGSHKLLAHFLRIYNPNVVFAENNNRLYSGNLFMELGFSFHKLTTPKYSFVDNTKRLTNITSKIIHLPKIYDCGHNIYILKKEK